MLSDKELMEKYREAEVTGHVTDINDPGACTSECDECPAGPACDQLAEGGDYQVFVKNYMELLK